MEGVSSPHPLTRKSNWFGSEDLFRQRNLQNGFLGSFSSPYLRFYSHFSDSGGKCGFLDLLKLMNSDLMNGTLYRALMATFYSVSDVMVTFFCSALCGNY